MTLAATYWLSRTRRERDVSRRIDVPWFIGLFLLASLLRTYLPPIQDLAPSIKLLAVAGFSLSLFLIGAGISMQTLRSVGHRPMVQGLILWLFISIAALAAARAA
jgi:uncharacterized membrane protein YadS